MDQLLSDHNLDALLISSIANITYLTNYSGFSKIEREAYLLVTKRRSYLLTDGRYTEAVKNIPGFTLIEISLTKPLITAFTELAKKHGIKKLGIEENNLTVAEYKRIKKCFPALVNVSLRELRIIKEENEINAIKKACALGDKTFTHVLKKIKQGVTEKELAFEIEFFIKKAGGDISFSQIVAFGENSAIPHHQSSDKPLAISDKLVLLDFGAKVDNYCSDMTRTVFFGKPTTEQKRMYQTVLEAQRKAVAHLGRRRGSDLDSSRRRHSLWRRTAEVDRVAREYIIKQGYSTIPHSLGHGIGLEVHESPSLSPKSKDTLKPGMVFSIEPGIYLPGIGGVRIEDLVVLEPTGPLLLTKSSKELIEL